MESPLLDLSVSSSNVCGIAGIAIAIAIYVIAKFAQPSKLDGIPTAGSNGWLGSWWAALTFLTNAQDVLQQGYEKYKPSPFKVAEPYGWIVVLSSHEHVEEARRTPEDTLSLSAAKNDLIQNRYTVGLHFQLNPYHIPVVASQLTRNIGALYPEVRDEIIASFDDVLGLRGNEWKRVPVLSSMQKVVCRVSGRVFIGLPLCRNPDWTDLNIRHSIDLAKGGAFIRLFPDLLKPIAARLLTNIKQNIQCGRKFLGPIIEDRLKSLNVYGKEWADKPNDLLSWLMDEAEGPELTVERLTTRMMLLYFGALHTSSNSFTQVLFYLARNPQYIQPLREEVETVVKEEGWSKAALNKMRKVDSCLRECQRLEGVAVLSLMRKAMKDFTFSDGTFIPKGTILFAASRCLHRDEANYENPNTFEPFRFSNIREEDGEDMKHRFVSTTAEYLPFGHGRRACPGRFFAASELQSMLAHVVLHYDIKMADDAPPPQTVRFGLGISPDPRARVMFRRRVD